jgi:NADPH2:quinone reductase
VAQVKRITDGRGVDVILDMVGGSYAKRNVESLAMDGRLVHISTGGPVEFCVSLNDVAARRAVVTASRMRPLELEKKREVVRELMARVWPHLGGRIDPVIDSVFPLEQAASSHARMDSSAHIGKILLEVSRG